MWRRSMLDTYQPSGRLVPSDHTKLITAPQLPPLTVRLFGFASLFVFLLFSFFCFFCVFSVFCFCCFFRSTLRPQAQTSRCCVPAWFCPRRSSLHSVWLLLITSMAPPISPLSLHTRLPMRRVSPFFSSKVPTNFLSAPIC